MKSKLSKTAIICTLATSLLSSAFAADSACQNTSLNDSLREVHRANRKATLSLQYNGESLSRFQEMQGDSHRDLNISRALFGGSLLALGSLVFPIAMYGASSVGLLELTTGVNATAGMLYGSGAVVATGFPTRTDTHSSREVDYEKYRFADDLQKYDRSPEANIKAHVSLILNEFIEGSVTSLNATNEEYLSQFDTSGGGFLGKKAVEYIDALVATATARQELYKLHTGILAKLESELEKSCIELKKK